MALDRIGRYDVVESIGSGGFASVYLADDPSLKTRVAIKVLNARLARDRDFRARFIDEARFLRRLAAPGLVTVHDIGEHEDQPFFVMEYCERGTLADKLEDLGRPVTLDEAMQLARVLTTAVDVLHRASVVHRDLKPANFMIRRVDHQTNTVIGDVLGSDEELVVGDFGLAKIITPDASQLTLAGGTPGFSAPEQFRGDGTVDARADVFAASATLISALSGLSPNAAVKHTDELFPPDAMALAGPLQAELTRGLSIDRSNRHPTVREWYRALEAAFRLPNATNEPPSVGRIAPKSFSDAASVLDLGIEHLADVQPIGEGGFSIVYRARHTLLNQPVAVKVLSRQLREADRRRFERECDVMGRMSKHPNVVTVHNAGYSADHTPYVMMELVEGGTLADLLERRGPLPWPEAVGLVTPVARALGHAHEQGILHRDVKPENILLQGGTPKLTDFGIAVLRDTTGTTSTHVTASWLHTAPETFENDRDERADLYSLASTLYHLVAGRAPFWRAGEDSLGPLMKRLITDPPPSLEPGSLPGGVDVFFATALAKDPGHRPQSAATFVQHLEAVGTPALDRLSLRQPPPQHRSIANPPGAVPAGQGEPLLSGMPTPMPPPAVTGAPLSQPTTVPPISAPHPSELTNRPGRRPDGPGETTIIAAAHTGQHPTGPTTVLADVATPGVAMAAPRRRLTPTLLVALLGLAAAGLAGIVAMQAGGTNDEQTTTGSEATTEIAGPTAELDGTAASTTVPAETITTAPPDTGSTPTPSSGDDTTTAETASEEEDTTTTEGRPPPPIEVAIPTLPSGLDAARSQLESVGLAVAIVEEHSTSVAEGNVIRSSPATGSRVTEGSTVTIVVSLGPRCSPVPNLRNLTKANAESLLIQDGFVPAVAERLYDQGDARIGNVQFQNPGAGTEACEGDSVTITVGTRGVRVPDVVDFKYSDARAFLEQLGLRGTIVDPETSLFPPPELHFLEGDVTAQKQAPNSLVAAGSWITLTVDPDPAVVSPG